MRVTAPVTDYIRRSILTTRGDLAVRGAVVPERLPAGADKTYFQGKGAGVIPAYDNQMPPLTTQGDVLVRGAAVPERLPPAVDGQALTSFGAGVNPGYRPFYELLGTKGDMWFWGTTYLGKLTAGALDTYLKGQGAAEYPIYEKLALRDTGVKIGHGTVSAGGDQTITGVGYRCSTIIFFAVDSSGASLMLSIGVDNGTTRSCMYLRGDTQLYNILTNLSIFVRTSDSVYYTGVVNTINADGFVITWNKVGVPIDTKYSYLCLP